MADAAGSAFREIHDRKVVQHPDRILVRADLYACAAGIAAYRAHVLDRLAAVKGPARQIHEMGPRYQLKDLAGAFLDTGAARLAFAGIYDRKAVRAYYDRAFGADRRAVTLAQTTEHAPLVTLQDHAADTAVIRALIIKKIAGFGLPALATGDAGVSFRDFDLNHHGGIILTQAITSIRTAKLPSIDGGIKIKPSPYSSPLIRERVGVRIYLDFAVGLAKIIRQGRKER